MPLPLNFAVGDPKNPLKQIYNASGNCQIQFAQNPMKWTNETTISHRDAIDEGQLNLCSGKMAHNIWSH